MSIQFAAQKHAFISNSNPFCIRDEDLGLSESISCWTYKSSHSRSSAMYESIVLSSCAANSPYGGMKLLHRTLAQADAAEPGKQMLPLDSDFRNIDKFVDTCG